MQSMHGSSRDGGMGKSGESGVPGVGLEGLGEGGAEGPGGLAAVLGGDAGEEVFGDCHEGDAVFDHLQYTI